MFKKKAHLIGILIFANCLFIQAQEADEDKPKKHAIQFLLGHTQIQESVHENGNKTWLSVPSFELNYNFELTEKWSIGLHTDIVVEDFSVENYSDENTIIKRSKPIAPAIVTSYKFCNNFSALIGFGGEFSKEENFALVRLGIEYSYEFHEIWELVSNITNDLKIDAYNSFSIGIGVARKF
tara:strand:+ start:46909 stop:47451 length:543 start_codon:yes stop_codon:yes gene_type:complete